MKEKEKFQLTKLVEHLSHELRTPLSAILGYSELLEKSENLCESDKKYLEKIAFSGNQLLDVINDIIEISNIESGNMDFEEKIISTRILVSELKSKFGASARLKELDFQVIVDSSIEDQFYSDEKKIKTIVYSLINNAIKFTEQGTIEVHLSQPKKKDTLRIAIKDTGIGISDEAMENVFKPFWQVNKDQENGTGLGLTTCQKLVQVLGGDIEIESEVGSGTQVRVQIPVKKKVESKSQKSEGTNFRKKIKPSKSLKALIVDDLPVNRTLARIMLEMKDFETVEAENGKEALEHYNLQKPDVVLMDISMPVMNGIEAMEKIRELNGKNKNIPIIAITAGGHAGSRSELIERGFSEYIQKPFKEKELFEKISLFFPLASADKTKKSLKHPSLTL